MSECQLFRNIFLVVAALMSQLVFARITPTAVWMGGEFNDGPALHGGYAVTTNAYNKMKDNGYVTIGPSASKGITIDIESVTNCNTASVLVRCWLPENGAPVTNSVLMNAIIDTATTGVICAGTSARNAKPTGYYVVGEKINYSSTLWESGYTFPSGEAYMLFSYAPKDSTNKGIGFYIGNDLSHLYGWVDSRLVYKATSSLRTISIGGPALSRTSNPWRGMAIKYVALFIGKSLMPADLTECNLSPYDIPNTISQEPIAQESVRLDNDGGWAVIGSNPIFISAPSQTNVFTVSFEADVPDKEGAIFGVDLCSRLATTNVIVRRMDTGSLNIANNNIGYTLGAGKHNFKMEYDHRIESGSTGFCGLRMCVDNERIYSSTNGVIHNRPVPFFSIGGSTERSEPTDVLSGLKVRNLRFWDGHPPGTVFSVY